jgi:flagellar hook-associated protein 2
MSTISSGTGLISGLPINDLVDALIEVQRRPITLMQNRATTLTGRRTALIQISAQLLSVQNAASSFANADFFRVVKAASSNESSIIASGTTEATPGQYTFTVRNLAAAHQVLSRGFASRDSTLVGAGTITIETAQATLNRATSLAELNGGQGVRAGRIKITDRAGQSATIDLTAAHTISDVVAAINEQGQIDVTARVEGDHLVLEDQTGQTTGSLIVAEVGSGRTAADLGLLGSSAAGVLAGDNLVFLAATTRLADLNDGNGVRRLKNQDDFSVSLADGAVLNFDLSEYLAADTPLSLLNSGAGVPSGQIRITNKAGQTETVDLSGATTAAGVKTAIESAGLNLTVTMSRGHFIVTDGSAGNSETKIEEVGSGATAAALGLVGSSTTGSITGKDVYFVRTIGDVLRVINSDANNGGKLVASISASGTGITLTDTTSGASTFQVTALNGSAAAGDLGLLNPASGGVIESSRLLAGLSTVLLRSLNGGSGVDLGQIQLTDRAGTSTTVDLTGAETLTDVLTAINNASTGITAEVSSTGLGIVLRDTSGGTGNLTVADVTGTAAADLGIVVDAAVSEVANGNLQRQYVSTATQFSDFRDGVTRGKFRITDSTGRSAVVDLTQGDETTLGDVIDEINSRGLHVTARINDTGDGLLLEDTGGGGSQLTVAEEGAGTTAKSLGILGKAAEGQTTINGTGETRITLTGAETLDAVLTKLRSSGAAINASIMNDGTSANPYRLSLTSARSGRDGALAIDSGGIGLTFETLVQGRDATVVFGPADAAAPLTLTSSTNTLNDAITGVRLELIAPSEQPVTITVARDVDTIAGNLSQFVSAFNSAISTIDTLSKYDSETETAAVLNADSTARTVRSGLIDIVSRRIQGLSGKYSLISGVGINLSRGSSLTFDEDEFRRAMDEDPAAVEALFTSEDTGFGVVAKAALEHYTNNDDGVISLRDEALQQSVDDLNNRISSMETLIEKRRDRLLAQFQNMETVLAKLQSQQNALASLTNLFASSSSRASVSR